MINRGQNKHYDEHSYDLKDDHKEIISEVHKTIQEHGMIDEGDSILVSVSGGPDSIFLLHALEQMSEKYGLTLYCFHLDHLTRSGDSTKDARFVEGFCKKRDIKLFSQKIDARKWCRDNRLSFQEGSRKLRSDLLKNIAAKNEIKKVAIGHTADDSIETFFHHLFRGSGLKGLSGILPKEDKLIRPLINTFKKDIFLYLDTNNIDYCIDKTNKENSYARNKIRNLLVPFIRENFSETFDKRLLNTLEIIRQEDALISSFARGTLENISFIEKDSSTGEIISITIPEDKMMHFPGQFKRRIFIEAISKLKGNTVDIKRANIIDIIKITSMDGGSREVCLTGNIFFKHEYNKLIFLKECDILPKKCSMAPVELEIGSEQVIEKLGIKIFSNLMRKVDVDLNKKNITDDEAYMDFGKIKHPVRIRTWDKTVGEKFHPLGLGGDKKIHDFFIDLKIPKSRREKIPVFTDKSGIIWMGRLRIDERVKLDRDTKKVLYIKIYDI